jgi:predicted dehydrogenase
MYSFNDKKQKIALIGCGYWGTIIAKTLTDLKFKNIIIFDSNALNAITLQKKFSNLKICERYSKILNDNTIKNIFFATPPSVNFKIVKMALNSQKNIFLEKPGVIKKSELKQIGNLSAKNKCKLMIGYVYCYNDYVKYIKKILNRKLLGTVLYINLQRQNLGPIRNDVSVADDLSSHDLSIILFLFKKIPLVIKHVKYSILKKNIFDISNLHMKLNKIYIDINNSWLSPIKVRTLCIIGSKKMLLFNEMDINEPIKIYDKYARYPKIEDFDKKFFNAKALIHHGKNISPKIKAKPALVNEIKHFLNSGINKNRPITDFKFSFEILKLLKRI